MKVYSEEKQGTDGLGYSLRYLLEDSELCGLQQAGLIGKVSAVIGMKEAADGVLAGFEKQAFTACGGKIQ